MSIAWSRYFPWLRWGRHYRRIDLATDVLAGVIVTIMLIPQSLAYAMLANLPLHTGLYAGLLAPLLYALCGGSRVLAVGPVAVVSLMTASAVGPLAAHSGLPPTAVALTLALMVGLMSLAMAALGLGAIAHFLSHPVISGLMSASALIIAIGQLKHIFGIPIDGATLPPLLEGLWQHLGTLHAATTVIGIAAILFLLWAERKLKPLLRRIGLGETLADMLARLSPVLAVIGGIVAVRVFGLSDVRVVGDIPRGLPPFTVPPLDPALLREMLWPALMITLIGFIESVAVAQSFAARRRENVDPSEELRGLGLANLAAACSGAYPVSGGLSRTVMSYAAGAVSPLAGVFTGVLVAATLGWLTPYFHDLPHAVLAATIIVSIVKLIDVRGTLKIWRVSRADGIALAVTALFTLIYGVETGLLAGVLTAVGDFLWRASRPHFAIVGRVPGTEHFRNVRRHQVIESERVLTVRVDGSLVFCNAAWLEDLVGELVAVRPLLTDVILMCPGVNTIDASGLESLERINERLQTGGLRLHLSEVKGPVMDRLAVSGLLEHLSGEVFLSQFQAMSRLDAAVLSDCPAVAR
ncbi:SulP family inorganic anion transporter [Plasticicumulans acidivorans]|uniref:SulP family sulfate permease n=1 Tax=Plasticicumulans acidivorans TaxID=886464 RepID=A0A317N097_9GAMM|nr:sulfate permease [Plasticicumulans acidivorans]PWV64796.1 SulP family sulfate permease [Plasticicumulans acidivorans]